MTEMAFMLGAARHIIEGNPRSMIIVDRMEKPYLEFVRDVLKIDPNRFLIIYPLSSLHALKVRKLHLTFFMDCGYVSPMNQLLTRQWIRDKHPGLYRYRMTDGRIVIGNGDVVVLDRNESGGCNRCLRNTKEFVDRLIALLKRTTNRRVVHLTSGELTVTQQMEIFARSELVVAPHGAGLTNMIFMPDNGKVLEIMNHPNYFSYVYYDMAVGLGLVYKGISSKQTEKNRVDFERMDVDRTLQTVHELLNLGDYHHQGH
jgi:hypothetical protein